MQIAVWDTYVTKKDGSIMHFDIIAPDHIKDEKIIHTFGKDYLLSKNQQDQALSSNECSYCHIEKASAEMVLNIRKKGYFIIEMQNCN
jgi:hypothetical protein